jgi:CPA1 family monovalent cation:H+ antiporter
MLFGGVLTLVVVVVAAFAVIPVMRHAGFPPAAATVLVGIAVGGMAPHTDQILLTPAVLGIFLPALIFESAWNLDAHVLRRVALAVLFLAVPGVAITALAVGGMATFAGIGWGAALVLGAILSATDPVAVLALFRPLGLPIDLLTLVEGESIANDGVAVVLVQAAIPLALAGTSPNAIALATSMLSIAFGGMFVGIALAALAAPLLRRRSHWTVHVAITLVVAYGSYALASHFGWSGIFASAAAGITLPASALKPRDAETVDRFWDRIALLANVVVFALVGLSLQLERVLHEPLLIAATFAGVFLSRGLIAYLVTLLDPGIPRAWAWHHAIALAGLRGGLPIALALGLPAAFPQRPQVVDAVFSVVFVTLVVQGWLLGPLARRLDFGSARRATEHQRRVDPAEAARI